MGLRQEEEGPSHPPKTTLGMLFKSPSPDSNDIFCVFKPSAQTHTVALHCDSHCHQPRVLLTLQLSVAAGHWADATAHIKPGAAQKLSLSLPESDSGYQISDGYIYAGDDLATANATRMLNTGGA